ncbi:hypothetical protein [Roseovarius mucosus]|uniref:hypothetical protein n=1 Tax=Roseovarius mucosus TaxID=215743 RepID=UPI0035CFF347
MAAPFKKPVKILLEKDCEFAIGIREGRVLELRPEGYFVHWAARTDPDTGECFERGIGLIPYEVIVTENNYGKLKIIRRPLSMPTAPNGIRRSERLLREVARQRLKKQFVLAIREMLDKGELRLVRDDFDAKMRSILAKGNVRYQRYLADLSMREKRRGGTKVAKSKVETERAVEFFTGFKSGHTMWKWFHQQRVYGDEGLFDNYRNCGKYARYNDNTVAFVVEVLSRLWDQERATIKSMVESVHAALDAENDYRERLPIPEEKLERPGYDFILSLIKEYAPLDHHIRKDGWDKAYKDLHALGVGIETSRALERVEIDEYTVDLFLLMQSTGLFDHMPEAIKQILKLDGTARRVTLSAAIDVHTRCLLALQIVPEGIEGALRYTLEMIYSDKTPISDAAGAVYRWQMCGAPEAIVFDRGSQYVADDAYDILAYLGITNLGAPAGKPWLKPFIERVFRTIHSDLLLRFSGRAFSNVVERGENNSEKRASLTLEAFLGWLVRWTVDAYHTRTHSALGMSPAQAWQKATKECAPRSLTTNEMREAFGVRMRRKLGRAGLRVSGLDYQSNVMMLAHLGSNVKEFEILRWHGDIGTISVRSDDGPWITVPACDEKWIGKTETDLQVWLSQHAQDEDEERARQNFINDANAVSYRSKRLLGLISMPKTSEELDYEIKRFMRFPDTAERRHAAGGYRELLDGLGNDPDTAATLPEHNLMPVNEETLPAYEAEQNHTME